MNRVENVLAGLESGLPVTLACSWLVVATALALRGCGLRGWLMCAAAAAPVSMGLLVLAGQALSWCGVNASPGRVLAAAAAFAVSGYLLRLALPSPRDTAYAGEPALPRWPVLGSVVGAIGGLVAWLPGIRDFSRPPQGNDDIWHGFLVRRLAEISDLAPATATPVFAVAEVPSYYYPYAVHLQAAITRVLAPVDVPQVMNGMWGLYAAVILPFSTAALVRALVPHLPWAAFWAGVTSPLVVAFPYLVNGLWPLTLTLAAVPGVLSLVVVRVRQPTAVPAPVLAVAALGLVAGHPTAAATAALLTLPLVVEAAMLRRRREQGRASALLEAVRRLALPTAMTGALTLPWVLVILRFDLAPGLSVRPIIESPSSALAMVASFASPWTPSQPLLGAAAMCGLVAALWRRTALALLACWVLACLLFVASVAGGDRFAALSTPWYGQWYRVLAVVGLLTPPLIGIGLATATDLAQRAFRRVSPGQRPAVVLVIGIVVLSTAAEAARYVLRAQSVVGSAWSTPQLQVPADYVTWAHLMRVQAPGDTVLAHWADGSTWMYTLAGIVPTVPYGYTTEAVPELGLMFRGLGETVVPPQACRELERRRVSRILLRTAVTDGARPFHDSVRSHPELFVADQSFPAGDVLLVDRAAVRACARST